MKNTLSLFISKTLIIGIILIIGVASIHQSHLSLMTSTLDFVYWSEWVLFSVCYIIAMLIVLSLIAFCAFTFLDLFKKVDNVKL